MFVTNTRSTICLCDTLRQATRTVTRMYDDALRPVGLRITQFSILAHLARESEVRVRDLGASLLLEETTLVRSLRPLEQQGWIKVRAGEDRRERHVSITTRGRTLLERAVPLWRAVQQRLRESVPASVWDSLLRQLPAIAQAAAD